MTSRHKPLVFLDVSIDGDPFERMIFKLFDDVAPKTAENFRALCTGEKGESSRTGRPLHYKGTFFHRIIKGSMAKGGDLLRKDGNFGESIYGDKFPDESPKLKHDGPGLLSMATADRDEHGSLFFITLKADHHLDRKCVVFGKLVQGNEILKKIEDVGDEDGRPTVIVKIINCGELRGDKRKLHKLKSGKNASPEANNYEIQRKGKHKKSSRRKKRRRHYSSDSESSSDDETESSDSDSESDSYESSSTYSSSSSEDRHRKRKRSKRDKYRRGKKDKRHEKRRKRRDKKSKRKSRRASDSPSETESGSEGNNAGAKGLDRKQKNLEGNQSPLIEDGGNTSVREKKRESVDMLDRGEGDFSEENGESRSNMIGVDNRSQRSADKQPDVVDDHPEKSRSRSMSPRRSMSKSMSISPRRGTSRSRSRSFSPKRKVSRSQSVSHSSPRVSQRGRSISPVRSVSSQSPVRSVSRSPVRGRKGGSVSASPPARDQHRRSSSRSLSAFSLRRPSRSSPQTSSRRPSWKSDSRSPARSSRRSLSRSPVRPRKIASRSPVRVSRRSLSRSSGRAPPRRSPSLSPVRAPSRNNRRSYSRSPRRRSPISIRGRSSSRSPSVEGSSKRTRKGRGFSDRYSYVRRYRSRSPDRSPVRSFRYGGRSDRDRYSSYRRSPRRYRSPPRGRTPPRFRSRRSRSNSRSISKSPIRYRRRYSRSPVRSRSPLDRYRGSPRVERRRSPSRSRSRSASHSSLDSQSPKQVSKDKSRSPSRSPPGKLGLVSYDDGTPDSRDSGRD